MGDVRDERDGRDVGTSNRGRLLCRPSIALELAAAGDWKLAADKKLRPYKSKRRPYLEMMSLSLG